MTSLPAVPDPARLTPTSIERLERQVATAIVGIDDLDTLEEWQAQAAALAEYLRGKEMAAPMLGAQRRVEARIGQLLGASPGPGRPDAEYSMRVSNIAPQDRGYFRDLARALDGEVELTDEEWRASRRALVRLIRGRTGESNGDTTIASGPRALGQQRKAVAHIAHQAWLLASLENDLAFDVIRQLPENEEKEKWRSDLRAARTTISRLLTALSVDD